MTSSKLVVGLLHIVVGAHASTVHLIRRRPPLRGQPAIPIDRRRARVPSVRLALGAEGVPPTPP
jgi:hypothetical protein